MIAEADHTGHLGVHMPLVAVEQHTDLEPLSVAQACRPLGVKVGFLAQAHTGSRAQRWMSMEVVGTEKLREGLAEQQRLVVLIPFG